MFNFTIISFNFEVQNYCVFIIIQRIFAIIFLARFDQTPEPFEVQTDTRQFFLQQKSKVCPLW